MRAFVLLVLEMHCVDVVLKVRRPPEALPALHAFKFEQSLVSKLIVAS